MWWFIALTGSLHSRGTLAWGACTTQPFQRLSPPESHAEDVQHSTHLYIPAPWISLCSLSTGDLQHRVALCWCLCSGCSLPLGRLLFVLRDGCASFWSLFIFTTRCSGHAPKRDWICVSLPASSRHCGHWAVAGTGMSAGDTGRLSWRKHPDSACFVHGLCHWAWTPQFFCHWRKKLQWGKWWEPESFLIAGKVLWSSAEKIRVWG